MRKKKKAQMVGKKDYKIQVSPVRKYIQEVTDRIHEFNIFKVWRWNPENVRKFNNFIVKKFENYEVLQNLMILDRLLQDLEENYKMIRSIRDNEEIFQNMINNVQHDNIIIQAIPENESDNSQSSTKAKKQKAHEQKSIKIIEEAHQQEHKSAFTECMELQQTLNNQAKQQAEKGKKVKFEKLTDEQKLKRIRDLSLKENRKTQRFISKISETALGHNSSRRMNASLSSLPNQPKFVKYIYKGPFKRLPDLNLQQLNTNSSYSLIDQSRRNEVEQCEPEAEREQVALLPKLGGQLPAVAPRDQGSATNTNTVGDITTEQLPTCEGTTDKEPSEHVTTH